MGAPAAGSAVETPLGTIGVEATGAGVRRVRLPVDRGAVSGTGSGADAAAHAEAAAVQLTEYADGGRERLELELEGVLPPRLDLGEP